MSLESGQRLRVGFVGVGAIAAAVAEAILAGPNSDRLEVVLSPRSAARSQALADRHPQARIASDNQAVVDACDVVFIAVLPRQVAAVSGALRFRAEQTVIGVAAGWPPSKLAPLVAPATTIGQIIPLPMIVLGVGPVVLYPSIGVVEELLTGCGTVVTVASEEQVAVLNCASAVMSSFFAFQNAAIGWAVQQGLDADQAASYVTSQLHGLATESLGQTQAALTEAVMEHETPGGLNEQIRVALTEHGFFAQLGAELDELLRTRF